MLYLLAFSAGVLVGAVGVVAWYFWWVRGDGPAHLEDILRDDPVITGRRDTRRNHIA
jgi:hypothetical protein